MAVYADPTHDGRVQREAASLVAAGYDVLLLSLDVANPRVVETASRAEVVGWSPATSRVLPGTQSPFNRDDPGTSDAARGGRLGWAVGYAANLRAWGRWAADRGARADLWHVHDFTALVALWLAGRLGETPFVYDTHELFLEVGSGARMPAPARSLLATIEGRQARRAAGVVTVNQGVADELVRRYRVAPLVVMNCLPWEDVARPGRLRAALGLGQRPVLLYHGAVSAGRGIEPAVAALERLPPEVALVVLGNGSLVPWVREQQGHPALADRLYWHPAVPLGELLSWVVDADLGVALIAPTELNFVLSTPNKLFECMTAGVPVLASDFAEMRRIVRGERIGDVCDPTNPDLIAATFARLLGDSAELEEMRRRARTAARVTYNWDSQARRLVELYDRIGVAATG